MADSNRPGAHNSDRAGEIVFGETLLHSTTLPHLQRHHQRPCRLVGYQVTRWLSVEAVEVRHE